MSTTTATNTTATSTTTLLQDKHPHPNDGLVSFEEADHIYTLNATKAKFPLSVTSLIKRVAPDKMFDATAVINENYTKWRHNASSTWHGFLNACVDEDGMDDEQAKAELANEWKRVGERARTEGTEMHSVLEDTLNGLFDPEASGRNALHKKHAYAVKLYEAACEPGGPLAGLEPLRTEIYAALTVDVANPNNPSDVRTFPVVCGAVDALFRDPTTGEVVILDWKRVNPEKKGLLTLDNVSKFCDFCKPPLESLPASEFVKYSLQLLLYKTILVRASYFGEDQIGRLLLAQLHPSLPTAHVIEAMAGMHKDQKKAMQVCVDQLLDAQTKDVREKAERAMAAEPVLVEASEAEQEEEEEALEDEEEEEDDNTTPPPAKVARRVPTLVQEESEQEEEEENDDEVLLV